jgi:hypothetical protein
MIFILVLNDEKTLVDLITCSSRENSRQSRHRESKQIEAFADKDDSAALLIMLLLQIFFSSRFPIHRF